MGVTVPDYVTHYHVAGRAPFLNLSDLPAAELTTVIEGLERERTNGASSRMFGRRYMELRVRTEEKLRRLFLQAGGRPDRTAPHYFVLGSSAWYSGLSQNMEEVVLSLSDLPADATSFTYPDSFTAMGLVAEYGIHYEARPYHHQVFRLDQLDGVLREYGMPHDEVGGYTGYQFEPFEKYIEVQLWTDVPGRP